MGGWVDEYVQEGPRPIQDHQAAVEVGDEGQGVGRAERLAGSDALKEERAGSSPSSPSSSSSFFFLLLQLLQLLLHTPSFVAAPGVRRRDRQGRRAGGWQVA